jgi:hypothetical protein
MTSFESYSLALTFGQVIVAAVGIYFVFGQLREMKDQLKIGVNANKMSNLMAVLALEDAIARSRAEYADTATQAALIQAEQKQGEEETQGPCARR